MSLFRWDGALQELADFIFRMKPGLNFLGLDLLVSDSTHVMKRNSEINSISDNSLEKAVYCFLKGAIDLFRLRGEVLRKMHLLISDSVCPMRRDTGVRFEFSLLGNDRT
jgi:hypothetical protein